MMTPASHPDTPPPQHLDLVLERFVDLPPEALWRGWTTPALITKWFTPSPWKTVACEIDLRPGGIFRTVMESPDGQRFPNAGCYLEVVPNRRVVWTNALGPDFRPLEVLPTPLITASISLEPHGSGTTYVATARHKNAADRKAHADMGFEVGWGKALDQLVDLMKTA